MTPCTLEQDPCAGKIFGIDPDGSCHANKVGTGQCDAVGACLPDDCVPDQLLAACDTRCILDAGQCIQGEPVATFQADKYCQQDGLTMNCGPQCTDGPMDKFEMNSCQGGQCKTIAVAMCGNYECQPDGCGTNCMSEDDCKEPHQCDMNVCK
jgi:hypothetical protein